jgi:hypothetical protein
MQIMDMEVYLDDDVVFNYEGMKLANKINVFI